MINVPAGGLERWTSQDTGREYQSVGQDCETSCFFAGLCLLWAGHFQAISGHVLCLPPPPRLPPAVPQWQVFCSGTKPGRSVTHRRPAASFYWRQVLSVALRMESAPAEACHPGAELHFTCFPCEGHGHTSWNTARLGAVSLLSNTGGLCPVGTCGFRAGGSGGKQPSPPWPPSLTLVPCYCPQH